MKRVMEWSEILRVISRVFLPFLLLVFLGYASPLLGQSMTRDQAATVAEAVRSWNGENPGDLFRAIRMARPGTDAIVSLRELNQFTSNFASEVQDAIRANQNRCQSMVRDRILHVRNGFFERYARNNPNQARSLYGYGDIGSWAVVRRDRPPTAEMDVDWTVFGANREATAHARDAYQAELLRNLLGANPDNLTLRDFDIVVTGEGNEAASHVFETRGGVDWARRNMRRVIIINPDGRERAFDLASGADPVFELAMAQNLAALRDAATRGGDYGRLFDANGNLLPQDQIPRELWNRYTSQLRAVDYFISTRATAPGGVMDMAIHQQHEAAQRTYDPVSAVKKNLKYVARADNIVRGARIPPALITSDPVLGDAQNADMIAFSREISRAPNEAAVARMVRNRYGGDPNATAIESVTNRARQVMLRYAEVAYQAEMDRIVLEIDTREGRKAALDALTDDFRLLAREGGEYSQLAESALRNLLRMQEANDGGMIDEMRRNWNSIEKIADMNQTLKDRAKDYLNQTELGRKLLEKYGKILEYMHKPVLGTGSPFHTSPMLDVIDGAVDAVRSRGMSMTQYFGSAVMWAEVVNNVRNSKTDAELAINLGHTLASNTFYGMVASSLYAGIVQRDAKALARAIMYMIVPETALPALVEALGNTSITLGAQVLFDHQLDAQYVLSDFDDQGQLKNIGDYGGRESAARELIDDFLTDGGETLAIGMFDGAIARMEKLGYSKETLEAMRGAGAIGKRALVRALESTVIKGNPLVMKDDGNLAAACYAIKKYTEEIGDLGKTLNLEVPEMVGPDWADGFDLGRGEKAALKKLMAARVEAGNRARNALALAIVRTFEERKRAETELGKGRDEALALLADLQRIFEELQVKDDGMPALDREGTYTTIQGWFTFPRDKQIKAMQAVLKFRDAYGWVLEARARAEEIGRAGMGGDQIALRPLTGPFSPVTAPTLSTGLPALVGPLVLDPAFDTAMTQEYLGQVSKIGSDLTKTLESIKGGRLEGDYDRQMYIEIYKVRFNYVYWSHMFQVAGKSKESLSAAQVWRQQQRYSLSDNAFKKGQELYKEDERLLQEFRDYYGAVKATVTIAGGSTTEKGKPLNLSATVNFERKPEPKYYIVWSDEARRQSLSRGNALSFNPGEPGTYPVKVSVIANIQGKDTEVASYIHQVTVQPDKKEAEETDKKEKPGDDKVTTKTAGDGKKAAASCSYEYSEWGECSRATKKQVRTVKATKPEGCVERQKPVLEQGCTPPPSDEEKKNRYLNCLCRCSSGWAGHIGVWYDPEGKSKPECESSGPCFGGAGAFGCTRRHFFGGSNDCAKGCWEGAYGKDTYDADKADKLRKEENKKYRKPLRIKLKPSKNPADFGDIITLQAEAAEGTGGYKYTWGGCAQDAKDAQAKVANTRDCKPCTATVTVTDQDGESASDSVNIQCNTVKVKLTKESPKENTVPVGGKATFLAEVFSGDKPFSGPTLFYLWERNPDAIFGDPKNPKYETSGGSQARNTATFRKAGTTPVWVTVLREIDGRKATIGESEQIQITVGNPELTIKAVPDKPSIGQEVKLEVESKPAIGEDIIGFWWEIPGYWTGTGNKASFKPKDNKPVKVTVHAKTKDGGDEVGTKDITITAQAFEVSISEPRYLESPPQIWKCDTQLGGASKCGMVTVKPTEFTVHRDLFMKATIKPEAESPRYRWSVDPSGSCGMPGSGSEVKINCSSTGSYTVKLEVTNADGAKLGEGTRSVIISISQEMLAGSKKSQDGAEKLTKAKDLVKQGKLDEGIALSDEASRADPKNQEALNVSRQWKSDKETITRQVSKTQSQAGQGQLEEARKSLEPAQKLHPKYRPVVDAEAMLSKKIGELEKRKKDAHVKLEEALKLDKEGKVDDAIKKVEDVLAGDPASKPAKDLMAKLKETKSKSDQAKKLVQDAQAVEKAGKPADALTKYKAAQALFPDPPTAKTIEQLEQRRAQGNKLRDEGANLARQGKTKEAIAKYRESLKQWRDEALEAEVLVLEKKSASEDETKKKADASAKAVGDMLSKGKIDEAAEAAAEAARKDPKGAEPMVRQVAEASKKEGSEALARKDGVAAVKRLETAARLNPADRETGTRLAQAQQLVTQQAQIIDYYGKVKTAFEKGSVPDGAKTARDLKERSIFFGEQDQRRAQILELAQSLEKGAALQKAKDDTRVAEAQKLRGQGEALQKQGKITEAVASYRESLKLVPDKALETHIAVLEGEMKKSADRKSTADRLWQEGSTLINQGKPGDGLTALKQSVQQWQDAERTRYVQDLESRRARAQTLRDEGARLQQQNQLKDAVGRYNESLSLWPDPGLKGHVATIDAKVREGQETEARKARAGQLRDEAQALQQQNRIKDAIGKYRESLNVWPDQKLSEYIVQLERHLAASQAATQPPKPSIPTTTGGVTPWTGEWKAMGRQREEVTFFITQSSNRISGTYLVEVPVAAGGRKEAFRGHFSGSVSGMKANGSWGDSQQKETIGTFDLTMSADGSSFVCTMKGGDVTERYTATRFSGRAATDALPQQPPVPARSAVLFDNGNVGGVSNNPTRATVFALSRPHVITLIKNYHWNSGRGTTRPGSISLRGSDGRTYGPWTASGSPGQGGVPNAYWSCQTNAILPAGTYTVIDSDPGTWAQNSGSQGSGHTRVEGYPAN